MAGGPGAGARPKPNPKTPLGTAATLLWARRAPPALRASFAASASAASSARAVSGACVSRAWLTRRARPARQQRPLPKKNSEVELRCDSLAYGGLGVCRTDDNVVIFCERALPGERVRARVSKRKKGYLEAYKCVLLLRCEHCEATRPRAALVRQRQLTLALLTQNPRHTETKGWRASQATATLPSRAVPSLVRAAAASCRT